MKRAVPLCFAYLQYHCSPLNITLCIQTKVCPNLIQWISMLHMYTQPFVLAWFSVAHLKTSGSLWTVLRCSLAVQAGLSSYEYTWNTAKPSRNATEICSNTRAPALQLASLQYPGVLLCLKTQYSTHEDLKCHEFQVHASAVYSKTFSQVC